MKYSKELSSCTTLKVEILQIFTTATRARKKIIENSQQNKDLSLKKKTERPAPAIFNTLLSKEKTIYAVINSVLLLYIIKHTSILQSIVLKIIS